MYGSDVWNIAEQAVGHKCCKKAIALERKRGTVSTPFWRKCSQGEGSGGGGGGGAR